MKIKLKRKLWFYPHRCPDCGKVLVITKHHDQIRCRKCGKKQQRRNKAARLGISLNKMKKQRWTHYGQSRYNSIRKECLDKRQADKFGINYGMGNPNGAKELLKKVEDKE